MEHHDNYHMQQTQDEWRLLGRAEPPPAPLLYLLTYQLEHADTCDYQAFYAKIETLAEGQAARLHDTAWLLRSQLSAETIYWQLREHCHYQDAVFVCQVAGTEEEEPNRNHYGALAAPWPQVLRLFGTPLQP